MKDDPSEVARLRVRVADLEKALERTRLPLDESILWAVVEHLPIGIWFTDDEGHLIYANPASRDIWGGALFVGQEGYQAYKAFSPDTGQPLRLQDRALYRAHVLRETVLHQMVDIETFDGARKTLLVSAVPLLGDNGQVSNVLVVNEDITERRRSEQARSGLQNALLYARKWEGLGVLAAGVAHDFNNLLTTILGHAGLARLLCPSESKLASMMLEIEKAAHRATSLTRQLLSYAGQSDVQTTPLDLTEFVKEMEFFLKGLVTSQASFETELGGAVWVKADARQLKQVVVNLVTNADEAFGDKPGTLRIRTGSLDLDQPDRYSPFASDKLRPGRFGFVEVTDTGCGMSEDTVARMFDPFFTTKFVGRGLGMAAVLGIVRAHGGLIKVTSALHHGTTVQVLLPPAEPP